MYLLMHIYEEEMKKPRYRFNSTRNYAIDFQQIMINGRNKIVLKKIIHHKNKATTIIYLLIISFRILFNA